MASKTDGKCPECGGKVDYDNFDWQTGRDLFRCLNFQCSGSPFRTFATEDLDWSPEADEWTPQLDDGAVILYREGLQTLTGTVMESHDDGTITLYGYFMKDEPEFDIPMSAVVRLIPWPEYLESM